ncbi:vWA domain-containing protein [Niabella yanshanensis]|uniref:VWA domain-containing protein n=1 Tax=Niabella yanshanensis TaxID=577386 RepID=A0ABZ0W079_9BACT|nr:vWA domain-containing protein [Niabella yanshanensis]WQD36591.1 vWA domain-containing protein [Niabella yanshanensis]
MKKFYTKSIAILIIGIITFIATSCDKNAALCDYDEVPTGCAAGMDVAFLIDYTGSMGSAIDSIKSEVNTIVNTILAESGGDYRLALGIFDEYPKRSGPSYITSPAYTALPAAQKKIITTGSGTDQHLTMMQMFAPANAASFSTQLSFLNNNPNMPMGWGIGGPEPGDLLLHEILNNSFAGAWRGGNITKLAIIITDAPASGDDDNANATDDSFLQGLATAANSMGVQCVLLTTFSGNTLYPANYQIQLIANNTGGSSVVAPTFNNISRDIISQIQNICNENNSPTKSKD